MAGSIAATARTGLIVPIAMAITAALFILMQVLIHTDLVPPMAREDRVEISIAEYVPEEKPIRTLPDPEPADQMPDIPEIDRDRAVPSTVIESVAIGQIALGNPQIDTGVLDVVNIRRDPEPLVRVEPTYPPRQATRGVEGMCIVEFDVLGNGHTANARIVQCDTGFERATIQAVERWRYSASNRAGPGEVALRGLRTRLDYTLD